MLSVLNIGLARTTIACVLLPVPLIHEGAEPYAPAKSGGFPARHAKARPSRESKKLVTKVPAGSRSIEIAEKLSGVGVFNVKGRVYSLRNMSVVA